ncbi:FCGBP protein, partial [Glareola pratincola]|nr:FCGBP protein [Glareola pratincola]
MCGNGNGDPRDDALMPDGNLAQDAEELGLSWKVASESRHCRDSCAGDCGRCRGDEGRKYKGEASCGLITQPSGPFESCHATINPDVYLKNCIYDLCAMDGLHVMLCRALKAYADDCQEEGIAVSDWRTPANCPLSCPKNSNYTACGTACPATCNTPAVHADCPASACVETCTCQEGFVFDANECIPQAECGCVFEGRLHGLQEEFWGDSTCTKRCVCDAESRRAVCRRASCRAEEECRVEEGIQDCYPKSYGTCAAVGTTHYESFDGGRFIFQGTCIYQMAGLCEKSRGLVDFQVLVQNGHQDDRPLAPIALVMVKVYGKNIVISQKHPGKITVNGQLVNLPYHRRDGKISIHRGGQEVVVETDFGLAVTYDWQSQVTVSVPSTYANALCGLCGNYNGNAGDEMTMKSGQATSNPDAFGHSWKVTDVVGCGERSQVECPAMAAALRHQEVSETGCGVIRQADGPFRACHAHVDAGEYFQNCVHDYCLFPDRVDVMCSIISRYAAACQAAGVTIGRWRTDDFCSISCPANSVYEICSWGCGQTCSGIYAPGKCSGRRCREGCACKDGFALSGDECVPLSRCGCLHQDFYYKAEETFLPSKEEKCRCQAGGALDCQKVSCPGDGEGKVVDGVFQCSSATLGTCVATGDRHYISFDGLVFNLSGTCSYVLAETCPGANAKPFAVKIEKEARQKRKVSGIQELSVEVYGLTLTLTRGKRGEVTVDSISHHLPAILSEGRVQVHQHGAGVLLQTDFGLLIRYDLLHHVTVTVPQSYQGHLCGLCGNYNGRRRDDFLLPGGQQARDAVVFGSAWKTSEVSCSDDCSKEDCPVCAEEKVAVLQKPNYCGILTVPEGPFGSCHHVIDPTSYFQACLHDLCLAEGDTHVLCQSIQSYAAACQDAGVIIEAWRRPSFCRKRGSWGGKDPPCPGSPIPTGLLEEFTISFEGTSWLGVGADPSRWHGGGRERCCGPPLLAVQPPQPLPLQPRESVLKENCQRRCTCVPGEGLTCGSHSCTDDETCKIRDGVLGC